MKVLSKAMVTWAGERPPPGVPAKVEATVEGLWKDITGQSWRHSDGNPAAIVYAIRSGAARIPPNDDVYYVKVSGLGYLVHESEIQFIK